MSIKVSLKVFTLYETSTCRERRCFVFLRLPCPTSVQLRTAVPRPNLPAEFQDRRRTNVKPKPENHVRVPKFRYVGDVCVKPGRANVGDGWEKACSLGGTLR